MPRSLRPTLRRWRRELEPVSLDLASLSSTTPDARAQLATMAQTFANALGRPVTVALADRLVLAFPV
jgi:hypothetical protein